MSLLSRLSKLLKVGAASGFSGEGVSGSLDYEKLVYLDAEDLAEQGIARAYERLLLYLNQWVEHPCAVEEIVDPDVPSYSVRSNGQLHVILTAGTSEAESWARATFCLFQLVNVQFSGKPALLYAINGGNDLGAMFLTPEQVQGAHAALPRKTDWPYLPQETGPWYGQYH